MSREKARDEEGFKKFEEFLGEWSRRDFLRRTGGAAAWMAFMAGGAELLEACGNAGTSQSTPASVVKGGKVIEGSISDIAGFQQLNSGDTSSIQVMVLMMDGLLTLSPDGNNLPQLASEVPKPSADGLSYTFKLRDAKWSDGTPITADDVVFTYRLLFAPETKDFVSRYRSDLEDYIASVTASDPKTVVFKMKKVLANFLDTHCRYRIVPKSVLGNVTPKELNSHTFFTQGPTVVSGMFKLQKWDKGQQVVLAANDKYWGGKPNIDQYIFKIVPDAVVLAQQLKTGELDVGQPDKSQWDNLATASNIERKAFPTGNWDYFGYNLDPARPASKLFADKAVRQALVIALNRDAIAAAVYFKQAIVGDTPWAPASWASSPAWKSKYKYDKAKAEKMLDDAGWVKGSDGIRAKGGLKMKFETTTNSGNKVRESLLVAMQEQWKQIGVDATPRPQAFQQLVTKLRTTHEYDIWMIGIAPGDTDPDATTLFTTKGIGATGLNGSSYSNPQVDKLMADALTIVDRAKRKEIYFKIQDILLDDLPQPVILYPFSNWGINKRVQGWKVGAYNTYQARPWMKDVWVTDGK
jgi:peptide/nickel transport system substrate-binding protein